MLIEHCSSSRQLSDKSLTLDGIAWHIVVIRLCLEQSQSLAMKYQKAVQMYFLIIKYD